MNYPMHYLGMTVAQYGLICFTTHVHIKNNMVEYYNDTIKKTDVDNTEYNKLIAQWRPRNRYNVFINKTMLSILWPVVLPLNIGVLISMDKFIDKSELYKNLMKD